MSFPPNNSSLNPSSKPRQDVPLLRSCFVRPSGPGDSLLTCRGRSICATSPNPLPTVGQKAGEIITPPRDPSSLWSVSAGSLRSVHSLFPLERTHVLIKGTRCNEIARRISECLWVESISADYNNKGTALAETPDHTRFYIRLFKVSEDAEGDEFVVEVQRRSGCGITFHRAARAVLSAAQGQAMGTPPLRAWPSVPRSVPAALDAAMRRKIDETIESAGGLLRKDRLDANILGVESLRFLTDVSSNQDAALHVAKKLFHGNEDSGCHEAVASLVRFWRLHDEDEEPMCDDLAGKCYATMHSHALVVLSNCLNALAQTGELSVALRSKNIFLGDDIISSLVKEVASAETRPHNACHALRSLNALMGVSDDLKARAAKLGAARAAGLALKGGACKISMLASESELAVATLQTECI